MINNTYKCAMCGNVFIKGLTEEEAIEQLDKEFPGVDVTECDLVCDDCYNIIIMKGEVE